jgi:integrase
MSRPSSLWQRSQNGFWYTKLNGKQVKLSPDKAEARKLLHKLLAADDQPAQGTGVACRRLLDTYLAKTAADKSEGRVKVQTTYFKKFCETFGHRKAESLKPFEVNDWLDNLPVAASTKALVLSMLKAGFAWGQREGYFAASPLKAVKKRKMARRERILTEAEVAAFLAACKPYWRDFFTLLRLTGMRPMSEAGALAAADLDHERKRAILWKHKNAKKTGKPRVLYFDPQAWEIVTRYAALHPTGPIFRTGTGSVLTSRAMKDYATYACERAGVKPFPVYTLRHTMLTAALGKGVPIEVLAQLAGNSPHVIRENYAKLGDDVMADVLAKAAEKAAG